MDWGIFCVYFFSFCECVFLRETSQCLANLFSCNTKITSCFLYQEHNKTANFFAVKKKGLGRVIILHIVHVMRRSFDKKNSPKMLWGVYFFFSKNSEKKYSWKQSAFLYFKLRFFCVFRRRIDKISKCGDRSKNCVNLWEWGVL